MRSEHNHRALEMIVSNKAMIMEFSHGNNIGTDKSFCWFSKILYVTGDGNFKKSVLFFEFNLGLFRMGFGPCFVARF